MNIFVLATNYLGLRILRFLLNQNDNILGVGLVKNNPYSNKIINELKTKKINFYYLTKKPDKVFYKKLKKMELDYLLSVSWPYILEENLFNIPKYGSLNFHLSFLPFNRAKNPNVWPIIDNSPAGVSIHFINNKIDDGEIVFQKKVNLEPIDTAKTLFKKLNVEMISLFKKNWINIKNRNYKKIKNFRQLGSFHLSSEFNKLDKINLNKKIYPLDLINHLRAKMFKPYPSAYFKKNNKKVFIEIKLKYGK
jgi:methionyl-tRNA formyltransferase